MSTIGLNYIYLLTYKTVSTLQPLFPGENAVDQLVEIIKVKPHCLCWIIVDHLNLCAYCLGAFLQVLGTPTREEIRCMNPNYTDFRFPQIKAHPWHKVCIYIIILKHVLRAVYRGKCNNVIEGNVIMWFTHGPHMRTICGFFSRTNYCLSIQDP